MIDLESALGSHVFIQMKAKIYVCVKNEGALVPAVMSNPEGQSTVVAADYLMGKLAKEGEQYFVAYTGPDRTKVRVLFDPEHVLALFYEDPSKIEVVSSQQIPSVEQSQ